MSTRVPSGGVGQFLGGVVITLVSMTMVAGAFLMNRLDAQGERVSPGPVVVSPRPSAIPVEPTDVVVPSPAPTDTPEPSLTPSPLIPTSPPSETAVPVTPVPAVSPSPSSLIPVCTRPEGWVVYTVQRGDTLAGLAWRTGTTTPALMQANCLSTFTIYYEQQIYLPSTTYVTSTPWWESCGPPLGWVQYIVQGGDTLYSLARRRGTTISAIRQANCLPSHEIYRGQVLFLPPLTVTATPPWTPTLGPTATPTSAPSSTSTPAPTLGPSGTPTYTPTPTEGPTSTASPSPTGPPSPTATSTPTATPTATDTPTATPTETVEPTSTATPTATPTATDTPQATAAPGG